MYHIYVYPGRLFRQWFTLYVEFFAICISYNLLPEQSKLESCLGGYSLGFTLPAKLSVNCCGVSIGSYLHNNVEIKRLITGKYNQFGHKSGLFISDYSSLVDKKPADFRQPFL